MSESEGGFGGVGQNTQSVNFHLSKQPYGVFRPTFGFYNRVFIQDLETEACAKINDSGLFGVDLEPHLIRSKSQRKPFVTVRKVCWLFLRNNPRSNLSFPLLGKIYGKDHTTVMSGYFGLIELLIRQNGAALAMAILNIDAALSRRFGPTPMPFDIAVARQRFESFSNPETIETEIGELALPSRTSLRTKLFLALQGAGQMQANQLAERFRCSKSAVRSNLKRLHEHGVVKRTQLDGRTYVWEVI